MKNLPDSPPLFPFFPLLFPPSPRTWKQRYLENTEFFGKPNGEESPLKLPSGCEGPILFYTGNEGPIDAFWGANGFMIADLAPKVRGREGEGEEKGKGGSGEDEEKRKKNK